MSVVVVDVGNTSTTVALAMGKRMCRKTRVPGKGLLRIELVPLAILMPPMGRPASSR